MCTWLRGGTHGDAAAFANTSERALSMSESEIIQPAIIAPQIVFFARTAYDVGEMGAAFIATASATREGEVVRPVPPIWGGFSITADRTRNSTINALVVLREFAI